MLAFAFIFPVLLTVLHTSPVVLPAHALGSACTAALGPGNALESEPYWLQTIKKQGKSPFNENPSTYPVRRNVQDYGATGDGTTDDTAAINAAISDGNRCGQGTCPSSTLTPALVYFPSGTYLVSSPIISWYYTQLIGDAKHPPTLLASTNFSGLAVIDADVYLPGGNGEWYINQNNFFREVRNFVIDLTRMPADSAAMALHWQVSQATSLYNIKVVMSHAYNTNHVGLYMENGSGGFMGDLAFFGGKVGMLVGNQQFTARNISIYNAKVGVSQAWNWGWTYQGMIINNCDIGFNVTTGGLTAGTQTAGAMTLIDATVTNTPTFVQTTQRSNGSLAGSLLLDNVRLEKVHFAVRTAQGDTVLAGPGDGSTIIKQWAQGNVYSGISGQTTFVQSDLRASTKPASLLSGDKIMSKPRPQYETYSVSQFVSVKTYGARGDGKTDDTEAIQSVIDKFWGCKIIFFDAGTYLVSSTIDVPANTILTGEVWATIMGYGLKFQSQYNPQPVVRVGAKMSQGIIEITDMIFSTRGPAKGAIVVEWNVGSGGLGTYSGTWDTHIRLGSARGTDLGSAQCQKLVDTGNHCFSAFMALHLTQFSSAYIEAMWVWNGDHDLDGDQEQVTVYSARGIYSESKGPAWFIGTAEHHVLYQYNLVNAMNHYLGMVQTESPYYQQNPSPPEPFSVDPSYNDPSYPSDLDHAWAVRIAESVDIFIYGAGLYSFFQNYTQDCLSKNDCQTQILDVSSSSIAYIYNLATVGTTYQLSVDEKGVINQAKNPDGFASTVTSWTMVNNIESDGVHGDTDAGTNAGSAAIQIK